MKEAIRTTLSPAQTKINLGGSQSRCLLTPEAESHLALRTSRSRGVYLLTAGGPTPVGPVCPPYESQS